MRKFSVLLVALFIVSICSSDVGAWPFRSRSVDVQRTVSRTVYSGSPQQVAQAKAEKMAALGMRGHLGGGFGGCHAEGTGRGTTAAAALSVCCFTGQRKCAAAAVVRGKGGLWYAVKLYW